MKVTYKSLAIALLSLPLLFATGLQADGEKVADDVAREVVDAEKQAPEAEKREMGEASGNVKDCEQANESDTSSDDVKEKDLDDCGALVK